MIYFMTSKFQVGDTVLVPAARMSNPEREAHALVLRKVLAQTNRSITVDNGAYGTVNVASRLVHPRNLGFLILCVGDFRTEATLLNPLAKSVLQFLRLLLPDDDVRSINIRTLAELGAHWSAQHAVTSHVVIIGHGSFDSVSFIDAGPVKGKDLVHRLSTAAPAATPKLFVSLACQTGRAAFAKPFSQSAICRDLIAPFNSVHGAGASQFCQSFFASHLLGGTEIPAAFSQARGAAVSGGAFRRWRNGSMC